MSNVSIDVLMRMESDDETSIISILNRKEIKRMLNLTSKFTLNSILPSWRHKRLNKSQSTLMSIERTCCNGDWIRHLNESLIWNLQETQNTPIMAILVPFLS